MRGGTPAANVCGARATIFWQHVVAARPWGARPRFSFVRHRSARRAAAGRRGDEPGRSASNRILVPGS